MEWIEEEDDSLGSHSKHQQYSHRPKRLSSELLQARAYLCSMKQGLKNDKALYLEFKKIMQGFKANSISVPDLVSTVEDLLKDYGDLILGFRKFLPKGYYVEDNPKEPPTINEARAFMARIQCQDECLYKRFTTILYHFNKGNLTPEEVSNRAEDLRKNYPDQVEEFVRFLPQSIGKYSTSRANMTTPQAEVTHMGQAKGETVKFKSCSENYNHQSHLHPLLSPTKSDGKRVEKQMDRVKREHRQLVPAQKLAVGNGPAFIEQKGKSADQFDEPLKEQTHSCEQDRHGSVPIMNFIRRKLDFLKLVKSNLCEQEKFGEYLKCVAMHSEGLTTLDEFNMQVADMFSESPELIGGSMDLVRECEAVEEEILLSGKRGSRSDECRKRAFSQAADKDELEANNEQRKRSKRQPPSASDASIEQEKGSNKLPSLDHNPRPCTMDMSKDYESKRIPHHRFPCTMSVEQGNNKRHPSKENTRKMSSHATSNKRVEKDNSKRHPLQENLYDKTFHAATNKSTEQDSCRRHSFKENPHNKSSHATSKTMEEDKSKGHPLRENPHKSSRATSPSSKYLNQPLSELDLSNCEQCTPSYRRLPDDYPLPNVGSRSEQGCAVLNEKWVSATSGSEDYSFKCMRKNDYEEILRQCEDDRTDLDMFIEHTSSTIRALEGLLEVMSKQREAVVIDHISGRHRRVIELVYGDWGLEVVECLHQDTGLATPLIMKRVKQKLAELLKYKAEMNKVWAEVIAKNYHKSLDHRNVHNTEEDMKIFSTQSLLAEIRNANAANRKRENYAFSIAYGESMALLPDVTLDYQDADVHEDVHKILQHSVKEVGFNAEELTGFMHLWKGFLEPLCGFHCDVKEEEESAKHKLKDIVNTIGYPASIRDAVKHSEAEEKEEGEITPSVSAEEISSNSDARQDVMHAKSEREGQISNDEGDSLEVNWTGCGGVLPLFTRETPSSLRDSVVFYGNDNMYILLRLHQALYERIQAAKVHAANAGRRQETLKEVSSSEVYQKFMQDLYELLNGTADSTKFESASKALAGNQCHRFLSIDKLICKLVKQLKVVASDEMAIDFIDHHSYELLHAPGGINDAVYHANACGLGHNEDVYRFERRYETGQLFIQLMEGGQAVVNQMDPAFAKNLSNFMLSEPRERLNKSPLFLKRNMDNQMKAFRNTSVVNGLQLKICCRTYEVLYVFGTEDYFHRRRKYRTRKADRRQLGFDWTTFLLRLEAKTKDRPL